MAITETRKNYDPRIVSFYGIFGFMLLVLVGGLIYRQLLRYDDYAEREKIQNQRRILSPGPRGNIYDREGRLIAGNRARFSAVLHLAELRREIRHEHIRLVRNFREMERDVRPSVRELDELARITVVRKYLDQIAKITGEPTPALDIKRLEKHFRQQLLLPFILLEDLSEEHYAKLLEQLPVQSPLQVYSSSVRHYPYASLAAHTIGYVSADDDIPDENLEGDDLRTVRLRGSSGKTGLEKQFDSTLNGKTGGTIFRVDPSGFRIDPPLQKQLPVQGGNLVTSLDIDLQQAAETAMGKHRGATVAININTGEILAIASRPDYNLNGFTPRLSPELAKQIETDGAWLNRTTQGLYPPGSTFKILTAIAGLKSGTISSRSESTCNGFHSVGGRLFPCHNRNGHGDVDLRAALRVSCNVFFYEYGLKTGPENIATTARRFHLHEPTGVETPYESRAMIVPDEDWKKKHNGLAWFAGDTANYAIGQGFLRVTPLQMACMLASFARKETLTVPTLLHAPNRSPSGDYPREKLEIDPTSFQLLVDGMEQVVQLGTGRLARVPGVRIAGKSGTAQIQDRGVNLEIAWFMAYAPVERPEIAVVTMLEGSEPDGDFAGGRNAAPVVQAVLVKHFSKKSESSGKTLGIKLVVP